MADLINPGNTRTFTLTEEQVSDTIDSLRDRIEQLEENATQAADLHTNADIAYFVETAADLRAIVAILDASE